MVRIVPRLAHVVTSQSVTMSPGYVCVSQATLGMIVHKVRQLDAYTLTHNFLYWCVECPEPSYGDNCQGNCMSQCDINGTATMECHHIDGPRCTCNPGYIGDLCQTSTLHILTFLLSNCKHYIKHMFLGLGIKSQKPLCNQCH